VNIEGEIRNIKGVLLTGTLDNPAKDALLNKEAYNSKNGCFCAEQGFLFNFLF